MDWMALAVNCHYKHYDYSLVDKVQRWYAPLGSMSGTDTNALMVHLTV
jgi:hypothetical protein